MRSRQKEGSEPGPSGSRGQDHPVRRRSLFRALKPLLLWLFVSAVLLAVLSYRKYSRQTTSVKFRVTVQGEQPALGFAATLNGAPYRSGQRTTIGRKTLVLEGPEFGSVRRKCFVWFGTNDLGLINLPRLRGGLEVIVVPKPRAIRVNSARWGEISPSSGTTFRGLPVGDYRVTALFDNFREQRDVQLIGNTTTKLEIKPIAGWVSIVADPSEASFQLGSASRSHLNLEGKTPDTTLLPAGEYRLRVWRGKYAKEMPIRVATGQSNRVNVRFEYGTVNFVTTPPGATITEEFRQVGRTPEAISELIPGKHRFRLALADYLPVDLTLTIRGDDSITVSTNLVNRHFAAAMERARWELERQHPNYRRSLTAVEEALKAVPESAEALALESDVERALKDEETRVAEQKRQREETRVRPTAGTTVATLPPHALAEPISGDSKQTSAATEFAKATASIKDAALFDTHVWTFVGDVTKVREAVLRTLRYPLYDWRLEGDSKINDNTYILRASDTALTTRRRYCVMLISQAAPGSAVVYAKFWEYRVKTGPLITFGSRAPSGPTYVPVHTNYYDPELAVKLRKALPESFQAEISKRLK